MDVYDRMKARALELQDQGMPEGKAAKQAASEYLKSKPGRDNRKERNQVIREVVEEIRKRDAEVAHVLGVLLKNAGRRDAIAKRILERRPPRSTERMPLE